jgi:transcriptional regulator with XRE-family HTH domain
MSMRRRFRPLKTAMCSAAYEACKAIAAITPPTVSSESAQPLAPAPEAIQTIEEPIMLSSEQNSDAEFSVAGAAFSVNMLDQLAGAPATARRAPLEAPNDEETSEVSDVGPRAKVNRVLRRVMAARLFAARNLAGFDQCDAALELGYTNSTQLSLAERGERLLPHGMLLSVGEMYGVSLDYLYGVSNDPDVDLHASARNAEVARIRRLLDENARAVAGVLLDAVRVEKTASLRETRFLSAVADLCDGLDKFQAMNQDLFDEAKGGALLLRRGREAREAIQKVSDLLDRSDRRVELALKDARDAMATKTGPVDQW